MRRPLVAIGAAAAIALTSACSIKAVSQTSNASKDGVKTDFGVDDETIRLGELTDLSGPFKANGLASASGAKIWADSVNAAGGICGRQIVLDTKDHGYKADSAVPLYASMKDSILGFIEVIGTPVIAALKVQIGNDNMLATLGATASNTLDSESLIAGAATFDIETINSTSFLIDQGIIANGDVVGIVYIDHEAGQNQLAALHHVADLYDLEVVAIPTSASDTDMTAIITQLKSKGVKALVAGVSPAGLGSLAIGLRDQGVEIPLISGSPSFAPSILTNPETAAALSENFYLASGIAPFATDTPTSQTIVASYTKLATGNPPSSRINMGYISGLIWQAILERACEAKDLTRSGIKEARKGVTSIDTGGLSGQLDLSNVGGSPTRATFVLQLDPSAPDGLKVVQEPTISPAAESYEFPHGN